jgi:hypothetical protein
MDESSKESSGERQSQEPEAAKPANEKPTNDTPAGETSAGVPAIAAPANKAIASANDLPGAHRRSGAGEGTLPVVWSPKLGGEEASEVGAEEVLHGAAADDTDASGEAAKEEAAASAGADGARSSRSVRVAMVAVSLAAAAAVGSFIGSLSATGVEHFWPAPATNAASARNVAATKAEPADVSALKANLDAATRGASGQLAKLAERLDRLERAQAEPAAKLARIAEALDRLEKKNAIAAASAAASPETTGSIPSAPAASEAKSSEKVLQDWIVREARGGRALIENRQGGMFDITAGSVLPGLGRVESVKRQDGQWIVVTARGIIYSAP